ncbi:MAG: hypothetical protein IKB70_03325 [Bacilli bacterium]|nr:hypothetical protein [Bacilli bacterium]
MKDFVKRMMTEKQELDEKKKKLFDFMTTMEYQNLSADEKFLLGIQYNAMCIYSSTLFRRINLYKRINKLGKKTK